ncbi:MAG: tRNA (adenosine(37)-N6)-threonylcarbamoyltransferase complex transferase subunit TsaD [Acidobacteria bacterium]|jgi:N6-L-threonylcarbamoyladenine synthase|nr:tRNA (adenosine(37)-N6)-threonylcarbamoyltransferase complex transferase subunit TsaD [Thermoanaerobaculia bacterium]NLN12501.1 tRNA (adenosine(37)-N6)-threonylcarbamoyltransferase complex transferase subunit TsaD [Acidobacteriota bacterium]OQC35610.1 MAG: tRNA N6-adenosine threonylcarbamoyltransferase [Acidobacteria bacterium ADurb.Bin051]MBP7812455.1 tRNA (adenosine(37)-N6)-threonylcarbamoyltransferase complex transferase subunit TsaD [Thermoanaerobaculia bacterium]MBP8846027.1 tRNA (adeno
MRRPLALGIETSCDDTACALVAADGRVLASVVASQLAAHRPYGGVVPEIASREHLRAWPEVSAAAFARAGVSLAEVDLVAATKGPGLIGSLLVGLAVGQTTAWARGLPFHGVHHLEGHLFSPFLREAGEAAEAAPAEFVGLVVSGGHTALYAVADGRIEPLAETRDDAIGEAFDKLGKRLGLPYPQGPRVDELAERGQAEAAPLTIAAPGRELFFSYSGLKTQALVALGRLEEKGVATTIADDAEPPAPVLDLLAGFRAAAVGQLLDRLARLHRRRPIPLLAVSGGVAANRLLRRALPAWCAEREIALRLVPLPYCGDNAAMIAWAAEQRHARGLADDPLAASAASRLAL